MSDIMLHGVLNMPPELWSGEPIDVMQRHSRYVQASEYIYELIDQRDRLEKIAGELIAMIRMNVIGRTFEGCTIEQIDKHLKPWINEIAAVKGGNHES